MKKLLYIGIGAVALVLVAIIALITLVNPNQFKPLIAEKFQAQTGLTLNIEGDLAWRFFPSLGLEVNGLSIDNPAGFSSPSMLSANSVTVGVAVTPLLSRHLQLEQVELVTTAISIETLADGVSNLDAFMSAPDATTETNSAQSSEPNVTDNASTDPVAQDESSQAQAEPWTIGVEGVVISQAELNYADATTGERLALNDVNFELGAFSFGEWANWSLSAKGEHNQQRFSVDGSGDIWLDAELSDPKLKGLKMDATYSDPTTEVSALTLAIDEFALESWSAVVADVKLSSAGNAIEAKAEVELNLARDFATYQLRNIGLDANVEGEALSLSSLVVSMPSFDFDVASPVTISAKGDASGLAFEQALSAKVMVDKAITGLALNDADLTLGLSGDALPHSPMALAWQGAASYQIDNASAELTLDKLAVDELILAGLIKANVSSDVPVIRYQLTADELDVDAFLAKGEPATKGDTGGETSGAGKEADTASTSEPDLSALQQIDLSGTTYIKKLKASNVLMSEVKTDVSVANGIANLKTMSAQLYDGSVKLNAALDGRNVEPSYSGNVALDTLQVKPLLVALADNELLEGIVSANIEFSGSSLISDKLMQNLVGVAKLGFTDGAINGINVAQIIRDNYAKIKGTTADYTSEVKKTDFSALNGTFSFDKGNVSTNDFTMQSPLLRVTADGGANYLKETIDANSNVSIVGSLEGQGGEGINDLKDLTLPLSIKGAWAEPKIGIDFTALKEQELERNKAKLEEKAKEEAERGLKKLLGDKASDEDTKKLTDQLLKKLF